MTAEQKPEYGSNGMAKSHAFYTTGSSPADSGALLKIARRPSRN
jgi:hypothetical protein